MKARRKSDGKIIEVETYMLNSRRGKDGSWESSYKDINSGLVYEASELLFNLDYYIVISGWVARDMDGAVYIHKAKPYRGLGNHGKPEFWVAAAIVELPTDSFSDLTWESDPIEVELIIKRKKK